MAKDRQPDPTPVRTSTRSIQAPHEQNLVFRSNTAEAWLLHTLRSPFVVSERRPNRCHHAGHVRSRTGVWSEVGTGPGRTPSRAKFRPRQRWNWRPAG